MSLQKLKNEINNDPTGLGYAGKTGQQISDLINNRNRIKKNPIPSIELLAWAGGSGRYMKLKNGADSGATDNIKSICWVILEMIRRDEANFDFDLPDRVILLDVLVTANVLNAQDKTDLENLANKTVSRSEELGLGEARLGTIQQARI